MISLPSCQSPELYSIVAALTLRVIDVAFFLLKTTLEVMNVYKSLNSPFFSSSCFVLFFDSLNYFETRQPRVILMYFLLNKNLNSLESSLYQKILIKQLSKSGVKGSQKNPEEEYSRIFWSLSWSVALKERPKGLGSLWRIFEGNKNICRLEIHIRVAIKESFS